MKTPRIEFGDWKEANTSSLTRHAVIEAAGIAGWQIRESDWIWKEVDSSVRSVSVDLGGWRLWCTQQEDLWEGRDRDGEDRFVTVSSSSFERHLLTNPGGIRIPIPALKSPFLDRASFASGHDALEEMTGALASHPEWTEPGVTITRNSESIHGRNGYTLD